MARKLAVLLVAALMCACFAGCGKTIEGNCSSVVDQCQSVKANERAKVVVTGYASSVDGSGKSVFLSDSGSLNGDYVTVYFDAETEFPKTRMTVEGDLMSNIVEPGHVFINHAKVRK